MALGLACAFGTGFLGTGIVATFGSQIAAALHRPQLMPWLWFVAPTAAVMGGFLVLNQLAVRHRRYASIGRRNLWQSLVLVATQSSAGLAGVAPGGMMLGMTAGQAAGAASLLRGSELTSTVAQQARKWPHLRQALQRYRRFPLVLAPSGLVNALGLQLPVLVVAYFYGSQVAGWLGMAQRVLGVPVTLIGTAVAQVYLGELVALRRDGSADVRHLFRRATRQLAAVSVPIAATLLLLGPIAFASVFGHQWRTSGEYARPMALALAAQLVAAPLSQTVVAYERQYLQLAWDVGRLVLVGGSTAVCALGGGSPVTAIWTVSVALTASYLASWFLSWRLVERSPLLTRGGSAPLVQPETTDV